MTCALTSDLGRLGSVDPFLDCGVGGVSFPSYSALNTAWYPHFSQSLQEGWRARVSSRDESRRGCARFGWHRAQMTRYAWESLVGLVLVEVGGGS